MKAPQPLLIVAGLETKEKGLDYLKPKEKDEFEAQGKRRRTKDFFGTSWSSIEARGKSPFRHQLEFIGDLDEIAAVEDSSQFKDTSSRRSGLLVATRSKFVWRSEESSLIICYSLSGRRSHSTGNSSIATKFRWNLLMKGVLIPAKFRWSSIMVKTSSLLLTSLVKRGYYPEEFKRSRHSPRMNQFLKQVFPSGEG